MTDESFADLATFVALPRLTSIALSPDGARLVATLAEPDPKGARYRSSIWDITPGASPARLTRSSQGESSPAFLPDGSMLFLSSRAEADAEGEDGKDDAALWVLPSAGEPRLLARSPGGLSGPIRVGADGTVVLQASRLVGSVDADEDATRRAERRERKLSTILHTGMPIRHWDHELGDTSPRLVALDGLGTVGPQPDGARLRDLTPDAGFALTEAGYDLSRDSRRIATTWHRRARGGRFPNGVSVIEVTSGDRSVLAPGEDDQEFTAPVISPDGSWLATLRLTEGSFDTPFDTVLQLYPCDGSSPPRAIELGELYPNEWAFAPDSATLYVAGDWQGRAPVVAVDLATGTVTRRLVADAAYSNLCPDPGGRYLYALRSAIDAPPAPVRLDVTQADQQPQYLPSPAPAPTLPGTLSELSVVRDGMSVRAWLCLPSGTDAPAPLMLWVHGGPFLSANAWNWRWCPWVAVAAGYAVLMPDPALSTGYGAQFISRAWPHRAGLVWADLEALLDEVCTRPDIDETRTACLGGSFGGYMTNWIAGHTDRFLAIVTHAGLWALDQQHATTDAASFKTAIFGRPQQHPQWYAENSPHHFVASISTPMLIVHGNRDYRVPISEALRLWWDLTSSYDGEPEDMPHRFLQLTGENHWVLSPANAQVWYETVLGFCDQHLGAR